jgi:RNA ligase (TIGR02306 family)
MKDLATIQKIKNIRKHPNADTLSIGEILGWRVVFNHTKDPYKEGDLVVYVVIDTVLPDTNPNFEFLRNKYFRIKPIRLRGEESAGICFPVSIVPGYCGMTLNGNGFHFNRKNNSGELHGIHEIGDDVADLLGIKHYEKPMPAELAGRAFGSFPGFLIITDEDNLRTYPDALPELWGRPYYITRKDDGSSGTFFIHNGEFGVCSRRIHLKPSESNGFWRMARKYDIENVLRKAFPNTNVAIQGEICGPGIQKNKLGLKEMELHVFNIFDITDRRYMDYSKLVEFSTNYNIPMVALIDEGTAFRFNLTELIELANKQKYPTGGPAEGIVIRPKESIRSAILNSAWSGKVLNENYKESD